MNRQFECPQVPISDLLENKRAWEEKPRHCRLHPAQEERGKRKKQIKWAWTQESSLLEQHGARPRRRAMPLGQSSGATLAGKLGQPSGLRALRGGGAHGSLVLQSVISPTRPRANPEPVLSPPHACKGHPTRVPSYPSWPRAWAPGVLCAHLRPAPRRRPSPRRWAPLNPGGREPPLLQSS